MLWEVVIRPKDQDAERRRVAEDYDLLTHSNQGTALFSHTVRGYLLQGKLDREEDRGVLTELLGDPLVESFQIGPLNSNHRWDEKTERIVTVLLKPGVMDPVAESVIMAARDLVITLDAVRTFRRYFLNPQMTTHEALARVLANDAIEEIHEGKLTLERLDLGSCYAFQLITVPLRGLDDTGLERLSREGQLALNLDEMKAIQAHFTSLGRDPTDVELETLAQTWSEHCSHKTLKGKIDFEMTDAAGTVTRRHYDNLLKETIFGATRTIRERLGPDDWCVSVFEDNAGVVTFDNQFHACFKVETHNHPSALEPYGGANTGLGGVIRDPLGTGLGAKPVCNTDVFCFADPNTPPEALPPGVLHPRKVMKGVVAGVRDYGNRMGIPTVNGAVCFDDRYLANPLVFCGTVGLIPVDRARKEPKAGDLIVAVGGRTGRDGIHGATFSSIELTAESEKVSGGAVQIGNAITEKKLLDVILQARDAGLYHAITDCGAGGFSSAVGEMGETIGAVVHLDKAPLKYAGLSYTEIWISESQERMILAVPEESWPKLHKLCAGEDVEATVIGRFEATGRLKLEYQGHQVADLAMEFLHHGRPEAVRQAVWQAPVLSTQYSVLSTQYSVLSTPSSAANQTETLLKILASLNVCSKEWIIRQYDHEVQGGSVVKPLVGVHDDGPSDAAVIMPVLGSWTGLAIGCGLNPRYGDLDPYAMAAAAIDEAVRNVVAVGADPARIALLDNFCWGNTARPEVLGSLVRAAEACRDVALAYTMPFISGKDSLNNEYHSHGRHIVIPPTLLISALGRVPDVRRCVTMDLKEPGHALFLIGVTGPDLGGSHYHLVTGQGGGRVPQPDTARAPAIFRGLHQAIIRGLVRACHDLSEGGLAVAASEMAFAGGVGADLTELGRSEDSSLPDDVRLFSESTTRFLVEVKPEHVTAFLDCFPPAVVVRVGQTLKDPRLRIAGAKGDWIVWASLSDLKEAWQKPLRW
jgi:phosphoribosylformylglycinamidine synthase II